MHVLIDTGCSISLIDAKNVNRHQVEREELDLQTLNSETITTLGAVILESVVMNRAELGPLKVYVVSSLPHGIDCILGLDVVLKHGMSVGMKDGEVNLNFHATAAMGQVHERNEMSGNVTNANVEGISIDDRDFKARFKDERWHVCWEWKNGEPPLNTRRPNYKVKDEDLDAFNDEIMQWINEGILIPWSQEEHGDIKNVLPLMAVRQQKGENVKIRPVLDFRFLNDHVQVLSLPGSSTPLCSDRLRQWRQLGSMCAVMDLRKAYLQVYIDPRLWCYQIVRWNGST